jgi:heat shock protein HtpX
VLLAAAAAAGVVVAAVVAAAGSLPAGLVLGIVVGCLVAAWIWSGAERRVLRALGARPVTEADEPRLHNLTEGLCVVAGLPKPALHVVEDDARNALAVGRDGRRAALVVTRGLLASLERIELEGVVAHELAHVKSLDSRAGTVAAALAPLGAWAVAAAAGPDREEAADAAGVALTRYPPGLIRALETLAAGPTAVRAGARATAHLWLAPGAGPGPGATPSLTHRIDALRELS